MSGRSYTMSELKMIVDYIKENRVYGGVKGRKMWEDLAKCGRTKRTWQSLKTTFLKRLLPFIHNPYFDLNPDEVSSFRACFDLTVSNNSSKLDVCLEKESSKMNGHRKHESSNQTSLLTNDPVKDTGEHSKGSKISQNRDSVDTVVLNPNGKFDDAEDVIRILESSDDSLRIDKDEAENNSTNKSIRDFIMYSEPLTPMMQEHNIGTTDTDDSSDPSGSELPKHKQEPENNTKNKTSIKNDITATSKSTDALLPDDIVTSDQKTDTSNKNGQPKAGTSKEDENDTIQRSPIKMKLSLNKISKRKSHKKKTKKRANADNELCKDMLLNPQNELLDKNSSNSDARNQANDLKASKRITRNSKPNNIPIPSNDDHQVNLNIKSDVSKVDSTLSKNSETQTGYTLTNSTADTLIPNNQEVLQGSVELTGSLSVPDQTFKDIEFSSEEKSMLNKENSAVINNAEPVNVDRKKTKKKINREQNGSPKNLQSGALLKISETENNDKSVDNTLAVDTSFNKSDLQVSNEHADINKIGEVKAAQVKTSKSKNVAEVTEDDTEKIDQDEAKSEQNARKSVEEVLETNLPINPCLQSVSLYNESYPEMKKSDATGEKSSKMDKVVLLNSHTESSKSDLEEVIGESRLQSRKLALGKVFGLTEGKSSNCREYNAGGKAKKRRLRPVFLESSDSSGSLSDSSVSAGGRYRDGEAPARRSRGGLRSLPLQQLEENGTLVAVCGGRVYPLVAQCGQRTTYLKYIPHSVEEALLVQEPTCTRSSGADSCKTPGNNIIGLSNSESEKDADKSGDAKFWKLKYMNQRKRNSELARLVNPIAEASDPKKKRTQNTSSPILQAKSVKQVRQEPSDVPAEFKTVSTELVEEKPKSNYSDGKVQIKLAKNDKEITLEGHWEYLNNILGPVMQALNANQPTGSRRPSASQAKDQPVAQQQPAAVRTSSRAPSEIPSPVLLEDSADEEVRDKVAKMEKVIFQHILELDQSQATGKTKKIQNKPVKKKGPVSQKKSEKMAGSDSENEIIMNGDKSRSEQSSTKLRKATPPQTPKKGTPSKRGTLKKEGATPKRMSFKKRLHVGPSPGTADETQETPPKLESPSEEVDRPEEKAVKKSPNKKKGNTRGQRMVAAVVNAPVPESSHNEENTTAESSNTIKAKNKPQKRKKSLELDVNESTGQVEEAQEIRYKFPTPSRNTPLDATAEEVEEASIAREVSTSPEAVGSSSKMKNRKKRFVMKVKGIKASNLPKKYRANFKNAMASKTVSLLPGDCSHRSIESSAGYLDSDSSFTEIKQTKRQRLSVPTIAHRARRSSQQRHSGIRAHPSSITSQQTRCRSKSIGTTPQKPTTGLKTFNMESNNLLMPPDNWDTRLPLTQTLFDVNKEAAFHSDQSSLHFSPPSMDSRSFLPGLDEMDRSEDLHVNTKEGPPNSSNVSLPLSPELSIVEKITMNSSYVHDGSKMVLMNECVVEAESQNNVHKLSIIGKELDVSYPLMEQEFSMVHAPRTPKSTLGNNSQHRNSMHKQLGPDAMEISETAMTATVSESLLTKISKVHIVDTLVSESLHQELNELQLDSAKKIKRTYSKKDKDKTVAKHLKLGNNLDDTGAKPLKRCSTPNKKRVTRKSHPPSVDPVLEEELMQHKDACSRSKRRSCPPAICIVQIEPVKPEEPKVRSSGIAPAASKPAKSKKMQKRKTNIIKVKITRPNAKGKRLSRSKSIGVKPNKKQMRGSHSDSGINDVESILSLGEVSVDLIHNHSDTCLQASECAANESSLLYVENVSQPVILVMDSSLLPPDCSVHGSPPPTQLTTNGTSPELFSNDAQDGSSLCSALLTKEMEPADNCVTLSQNLLVESTGKSPNTSLHGSLFTEDLSENVSTHSPSSQWQLPSENESVETQAAVGFDGSEWALRAKYGSHISGLFPVTCCVPDLSTITENTCDTRSNLAAAVRQRGSSHGENLDVLDIDLAPYLSSDEFYTCTGGLLD